MGIPINSVVEGITRAVQNANFILEHMTLERYFSQGYTGQKKYVGSVQENLLSEPDTVDMLEPITYKVLFKNNSVAVSENDITKGIQEEQLQYLEVPLTALVHHNTMELENVDVTLRFGAEGIKDDKLMVELRPENRNESVLDTVSEMTLHYKKNNLSEGMARVEAHHYQRI